MIHEAATRPFELIDISEQTSGVIERIPSQHEAELNGKVELAWGHKAVKSSPDRNNRVRVGTLPGLEEGVVV